MFIAFSVTKFDKKGQNIIIKMGKDNTKNGFGMRVGSIVSPKWLCKCGSVFLAQMTKVRLGEKV